MGGTIEGKRRYKEILYLQPRNPEVEIREGRRETVGDALNAATGFGPVLLSRRIPRTVQEIEAFMAKKDD